MSYSDIMSDGGMDPRNKLEESMYRLTVAQRDAAWREIEMWQRRYDELAKMLANHAALQRPPVMLADKESYEAGRFKGIEEGAAAEREAMVALAAKQGWAMKNEDPFEDAVREIAAMRARGQA